MDDVSAYAIAPAQLPRVAQDLVERLQCITTREQYVPAWLPHELRIKCADKSWGECAQWLRMTQARINAFADAVEDRQYLHTDPVAARLGPYGTTICHGDHTTSMDVRLIAELGGLLRAVSVIRWDKYARLVRPVRVDSELGMRMRISSCHRLKRGEGVEIFYEFEALQHEPCKPVALGFGTLVCMAKVP